MLQLDVYRINIIFCCLVSINLKDITCFLKENSLISSYIINIYQVDQFFTFAIFTKKWKENEAFTSGNCYKAKHGPTARMFQPKISSQMAIKHINCER